MNWKLVIFSSANATAFGESKNLAGTSIRLRMGVPMGVVVWGYRGGVGTLRIPYKLSTFGGFRHTNLDDNLSQNREKYHHGTADTEPQSRFQS